MYSSLQENILHPLPLLRSLSSSLFLFRGEYTSLSPSQEEILLHPFPHLRRIYSAFSLARDDYTPISFFRGEFDSLYPLPLSRRINSTLSLFRGERATHPLPL